MDILPFLLKIESTPKDILQKSSEVLSKIWHKKVSSQDQALIIEAYLAAGGHIDAPDRFHFNPLIHAIGNKDVVLTEYILSLGADINRSLRNDNYPLQVALNRSTDEVIKLLLDRGATKIDSFFLDDNILGFAIYRNRPQIIQTLYERGFSMNGEISQGMTALMWAVQYHHVESVEMLIKCGADVNEYHKSGELTALCFAVGSARREYKKIASLLMDAGADPTLASKQARGWKCDMHEKYALTR